MSDPSGFRPIYSATLAEETEEMRKASLATMRKSSSSQNKKSVFTKYSNGNSISRTWKGNAKCIDTLISFDTSPVGIAGLGAATDLGLAANEDLIGISVGAVFADLLGGQGRITIYWETNN